jgi:hypothetical protein
MTRDDFVEMLVGHAQEVAARSEALAARSLVLVDASRYARREEMFVPRCTSCGRVALGGVWLRHDQVPSFVMTAISHRSTDGICPSCFSEEHATPADEVLVHAGSKDTADRLAAGLDAYDVRQRPDHVLAVHVAARDNDFLPRLLSRLAECLDSGGLDPVHVRIGGHAYRLEGR